MYCRLRSLKRVGIWCLVFWGCTAIWGDPKRELGLAEAVAAAEKAEPSPAAAQPSSESQSSGASARTEQSGEKEAVAFLRNLGAAIKTNAQGRVVLVDLAGGKASDEAAKRLADLPELKSLRWTGQQVTDATAEVLAGLPKLTVLKLDETRLSDAGLARLKKLSRLEELYLAKTQITDAGLEHIGQMGRVRRLRLSETKITGSGLAKLAGLQELMELDVSRTGVDDASLAVLTKLPKLTRLNLYTTPITDAGLEHLAQMAQLVWLNLDNTQVTDAGLPKLQGLKNLEFLHLGRTQITDAGLGPLAGLKQLKTLHLTNTRVTAEGAARLQTALPECKILAGATGESKPSGQPKPTASSSPPTSAAQSPGPAAKGLKVRLECTVRQYDPTKPDGVLVGLVENLSDKTVEVPAGYDSERVLLWAKAEEHPAASAYWDRSRQKPTIPTVRLAPGEKQEFFRWPLQEVLADRHKTWRADYQAGKRFLVWDWENHAHPPYSPIYRMRGDAFTPKADFWLVLKLGEQTFPSEKIALEVKIPSGP